MHLNWRKMIRLNNFLASAGICSRRQADEYIKQGRVDVNKKTVIDLSINIDPEKDTVMFDGVRVKQRAHVYILLNKPKGVVSTTSDEKDRKTVLDLIKTKERIFPVGRLDYNTTGVILLTNDGDFTNYMLHPGNKIPRTYVATLHKPLLEEDKKKLEKGFRLEGKFAKIEKITILKKPLMAEVTVTEGRNHFIKNVFKKLGYFVDELHRKAYASFNDKDLPSGAYRYINENEIKNFYKHYGHPEE